MENLLRTVLFVLDNRGMKNILAAGAVLDGLAIAGTQYFGFGGGLHYVWAVLAIVWGFLIWKQK